MKQFSTAFTKYTILLFTALFFVGCTAQPIRRVPTETFFTNDPALVTGELENGLRYFLMQNEKPADRVSMHLAVQAGSMDETEKEQGLAHYLEHMLFNGTEHFPPGELVKYFQSIGMAFGGDANAHTGFYETVYDILLPKGDKKSLAEGLVVMRDYAGSALLLEEEVDRERNIILAEKRDRNSAGYRIFEKAIRFELGDMRATKRLPIGIVECIEKADRKRLKHFYDTWYRPENMFLVIAGDFDTTILKNLISEKFATLTSRAPAAEREDPGSVDHSGMKTFHHFEKDLGKTSVSIETIDDTPEIPDSLDFRKKTVALSIANIILRNRLDIITKKPDSPFTSACSGSGIYLKHIRYTDISADCSPENWKRTLSLLEQTLRAALTYGFYPEELNQVKRNYIADLEQAVKEAPTRESGKLARRIIHAVSEEKLFLSPESKLKLFRPFVENLGIDEINSAFRNSWDMGHRLILVTGNADLKSESPEPEKLIAVEYNKSLKTKAERPEREKAVNFPYLPEPEKAGRITARKTIPGIGVTTVVFENGIRLNLKKTDFKANQVLYSAIFGYGRKSEPETKPGLSDLSSGLINKSGFGRLDTDELKRALAGKNTDLYFGVQEECFSISGSGIPEETELMFRLLRTQLLDPAFRKNVRALIMEKMKQAYEKMGRTVEGADKLHSKAFIAGGDSRFGLPPYEVFSANTPEDVKNWVENAMAENELELSVVGDIDIDAVIDSCAKYLGSLPAGKKPFDRLKVFRKKGPVFPAGKSLHLEVKSEVPKSLVRISYKTDDFWDISRTRRLSALSAVFSDRLRNIIREELGAAYSPYAYNSSSIAYPGVGVFSAVVSVEPGTEDFVIRKIHEISDSLVREKIDQEELNRAIDPIMTHIKDLRKTNEYWIGSVMEGSSRYPEKFDWALSIEKDYRSITTEDIHQMAKKYLKNNTAATVRIATENR